MSTGADPKTMPITADYADGYDRVFGKREPVRGHWVYDAEGNAIPASEYVPEARYSVGDGIASGRFYDGTQSPIDGADIGSRQKYNEHMKRHGVTHFSDFTQTWAKAEEKRERVRRGEGMKIPGLRESIERAFYKIQKP